MKENKVLSVIYGIALFVALIGVVALLYNAIEMLSYTTFYDNDRYHYFFTEEYTNFQAPIAIAILVSSIVGIIGVGAGAAYLFVKKPLFKIICLSFIAVSVAAIVAALIVVCCYWNINYKNELQTYPYIIQNTTQITLFAVYSEALASVIENLVCYAVIAAVLVYDFVKCINDKKKETAIKEIVVKEITE